MKLAFLILALSAVPAFGYDTRFVQPGATVRVTASERAFEGILVGQDSDTIRVVTRAEGERRIAQADVSQFRVRTEMKSHSKTGMFLGFLAGAAFGAVMDAGSGGESNASDRVLLVTTMGLLGASAGAMVGGVVPNEQWENVP